MNIGIFVTTLNPLGASQRRMQETLLSLLIKKGSPKYSFFLFSYDSEPSTQYGNAKHIPLGSCGGLVANTWRRLRSFYHSFKYYKPVSGRYFCIRSWFYAAKRSLNEPFYFADFREHNIRLLYNLNQHWLKAPVPYIQTVWDVNHRIHSFFPEYSYARFGFSALDCGMSQSLARASFVITGTQTGANELISMYGLSQSKSRVIPFPTPSFDVIANTNHQSSIKLHKRPYLFYPARLWPHKNHAVIVYALAKLKQQQDLSIDCILVGENSGNHEHLRSLATDLKVDDQVIYLGDVQDDQLPHLYKDALALVFASPAGPDNLPPLEAMAHGCPAIVAHTEGAKEQLGEAALFFEPYNESDLANKIHSLYSNQGLRQELIEKGIALASKRTSLDYVESVFSIFHEFSLVSRNWARCDSRFK